MSRQVRHRFAAPLVLTLGGAACSSAAPAPTPTPTPTEQPRWNVHRTDRGCEAYPQIKCEPNRSCNPPPPIPMACPPEAPPGTPFTLTDIGGACRLDGTEATVTCPTYEGWKEPEAPPPVVDAGKPASAPARRWALRSTSPGTCEATLDPCGGAGQPACAPPATIECPGLGIAGISEFAPGECWAMVPMPPCPAGAMCNPPPPMKIGCPGD